MARRSKRSEVRKHAASAAEQRQAAAVSPLRPPQPRRWLLGLAIALEVAWVALLLWLVLLG